MIDSVLNLLFRCSHRRLTRPVASVTRAGQPRSQTYVVCLDCGKQFEYDLKEMRMGKPIDPTRDGSEEARPKGDAPGAKTKAAMVAAAPLAVLLGAIMRGKRKQTRERRGASTSA